MMNMNGLDVCITVTHEGLNLSAAKLQRQKSREVSIFLKSNACVVISLSNLERLYFIGHTERLITLSSVYFRI